MKSKKLEQLMKDAYECEIKIPISAAVSALASTLSEMKKEEVRAGEFDSIFISFACSLYVNFNFKDEKEAKDYIEALGLDFAVLASEPSGKA